MTVTASRTLIENVSIFDGTGSPAYPGAVLVEGRHIAAISREGGELPVDDALVIDGRDGTLMPGLVECHCHITYPNSVDRFYPHLYPPEAVETTLMTVHNAQVLIEHGFTSAYSAGAIKPGIESKLRDEIAAGRIPGPRLRSASMEVYFPGDPDARPMPRTTEELRRYVRESADEGVDVVKVFLSGLDGVLDGGDWDVMLDDASVALVAQEASAKGLWLSAHVRPAVGLKQGLRSGFRVLYHAEEVDDEALDLLAARKDDVFIGPTIGGIAMRAENGSGKDSERSAERLSRYRKTVDRIRASGVRVVPFGDYGFPGRPHGMNARDLRFFVDYLGFSPAQALRAATQWGGELMGREKIGLIAPGYLADLLVVDGNPVRTISILENRANLFLIMQDGRFVKAPAAAVTA